MKYKFQCSECEMIQESDNWIALTTCKMHRERLNPETLNDEGCDSLNSVVTQRGESEEVFPPRNRS